MASALNAVVVLAVEIVMSAVVGLVAASGLNAMAPRGNVGIALIPRAAQWPFDRAGRNNRFDRGGRSDRTDRGGRPAPRYGRPQPDLHREPEAEPDAPEYNDLVWGLHASQAILESERPIHRIWCTPELRFRSRFLQLLREARPQGCWWKRSPGLGWPSSVAPSTKDCLQTAAAQTHDLDTLIDSCAGLGEAPC